ncbi:MAG: 16S rRNA (cytosine(967)-C(5))-methyltransferase RsmB [Proteobacteria bacterium]|nr:16S rRNA (cytosine(967)-C(5))-methyltransferase RsmB [Pseudomonadota bacterium]
MSPRLIDARELARQVLRRVRRDQAYSNLALAAAFDRAPALGAADRALATELVYGVLRQQRRLDAALGPLTRQPVARIDADVLDVLRLAVYQLALLDRIPDYAVVDAAVRTVKTLRGPRQAGFVNAVLRRLAARTERLPAPAADPLERLVVDGSLPDALADQWVAELGLEVAERLALSSLERPPLVLRINDRRASLDRVEQALAAEGATVARGRWSPLALSIEHLSAPFASASYLGGLWTAQDEAAQLVGLAVGARPGEAVLDACAGLGGKALQLAQQMTRADGSGAEGLLACDVSERKLELLREHALRLGLRCATRRVDITSAQDLDGGAIFDRVLVDAPCSGLGVLRRHPELKWRWRPEAVEELVALQRALLRGAARLLRPGGLLVYAVCTVSAAEGPQQRRWADATLAFLEPAALTEDPLARVADGAEARLWPHEHGTDGFYLARWRRREGS